MSDADRPDLVNLTRALKRAVDDLDEPTQTLLVNEVASRTGADFDAVETSLEELLRTGELYQPEDSEEVRRP